MSAEDSRYAGRDRRLLVWKASWLPASETFVRNQVEALATWEATTLGVKRVESTIASHSDCVPFGDSLLDKGWRQWFLRSGRSRRLETLVGRGEFALVHAHFLPDATLIEPIARRASVPLVITVHGRDVTAVAHHPPHVLERMRATLGAAVRIIAVSEFIAERAIALGAPEERVVVHHIGIPTDKARPAGHAAAEWDVCFVGRLVEKKGIVDGIEAMSLAQAQLGRPLSMAIVGDGPLRAEIAQSARARGVDVTLMGSLSPQQVADVLGKSKVFLGPSKTAPDGDSEGFGMVFLEAGLASIPVVAYRHGGVPEAVEHGVSGLLSPEGDFRSLGQSIELLLNDEGLRAELGAASRRRVEDRFEVGRQTEQLEAIYDSIGGR